MSLISKSKNFKLSAWQDNQIQLFVVQGEGGIKTAQFTLTDDNGVLDLTAASSVTYNATKHNSTACCIDCSIVDAKAGAIELKIETGITDVVGNVDGEIEVINENGSIKFHGITICVKGGTVEDLIQASSEFSALVKALNKVALLTPEGTITLDDELTDDGINPAPSGVVKQYVDNEVDKKLNDKNGVIKTAHLGEEAVTSDKLSSGAVTTDKIEFGAVTENELDSELVEKINSKANADLCIKQSSTQLIKLTDIDTSINGLHIIIKNNHISVKGTAEKGVYSSIAIETGINQFEANTSYTASIQNLVDNTAKTDYIGLYCSGVGVPITEADEHKVLNFTTDTQVSLNWNIQAGEYDKEFDFQIEFGSEVTSFEPYYVVSNIANGSVSKEKLSEDVQDSLNVMNVELPKKAESSDLLNKSSFFEFEDITSTVGVETGYYGRAFNHNSIAKFECTSNPISCKPGDIFKITSATVNMDGRQAIVKCYDKNQALISSDFEASGKDILTVTDKLFIVPENVEYVAFNCWKHDNNLYNLKVEKAKPYTNNYGLLVNTLVSALPSNELLGKTIYSDGDSIAQGTGTANRSYVYLLADKYNMTLTSRAVGGTTIAVHPDNGDNKSIYERITENITSDSQYDYIILDGGTNDVTKSIPLGTITDGVDSEFDTSTVLGALEATCKHLNTVQLTAKKLFVFVTNRVEMLKTTKDTFSKMKQVLNKWGIPYIDLSTINSLGRWNDTVAEDYFADEIHPNLEAHKEFYLPYIEKALLYGSYANDSSDSNVSVSLSSDEKNEIIAQVIATLPDDVIGISDAEINNDGELVITYTDKSSKGLGVVVGQDGKDGVSCTHVWSGDTLIVTSASGTSSRNLKGETGADGYTPVRGIDYYTSEDKAEIVDIVKSEVPLVKSAEQPNFANSVDEMTDTNKVYVMPDGYLYGYKQNVNYNLLKPNEVEFSTRLQDDIEGTTSSTAGNVVTGWIPVEYGKYYCISWLYEGTRQVFPGISSMYKRMNVKKADGTIAVYNSENCSFASGIEYSKQVITIEHEDAVAVRIHYNLSGIGSPNTMEALKALQPMFVEGATAEQAYQNAINLEYIDGDTESIAEWYNTGLAYNQPADYEERILKLESDVSELEKSDDANDKTEIAELRSRLIGSMDIPNDGYIIGTMYTLELAISEGQIANTAHSHGIVTDYIPCTAENTITVDSDKYTFQVMEYQEKDVPKVYSGVLNYGTTYNVTQSGYVRICIRYVDNTQIADSYLFNHIVANLTGYYDFSEFEQRTYKPSSSPYYRNVDFGVIPFSYYRGVGDDYISEGFNKNTTYANYIEAWKSLITNHSSYVTETALGTASDGQMIYLYDFKPVRISNQNKSIPKIIIVAGQHGTEKCNVFGWYYFVRDLLNNWNKHPALEYLRNHVELMIVPVVNTYGFDNFTYKNANEVNINRNYNSNWTLLEDTTSSQYGGAEPFDQPESQIIRDLILSNEDALMVVDSHTCSSESAVSYDIMTYCGVCANTDNYYNRMLDVASHHLSSISANFNIDYELNQPDTIMGYMNTNSGNGILRSWATDNNYIGVLTEGFAGFPNYTAYTGEVYKANEEFVVNYLITAMNYLNK